MRLRQWPKNAFVFAPIVFDRQLLALEPLLRTGATFLLFCLLSSAVYIFNDILDINADRNHPVKRLRPIASGKLPVSVATWVGIVLLVVTLVLGYFISYPFALIALVYFLMNVAYSRWLKHISLIDVFTLAAGFVLRVAAGVVVIQIKQFSPWLFVVMTFSALYLGFAKRRAEMATLSVEANNTRPVLQGYTIPLLDQLLIIVTTSTIVSYSLYTFLAPIIAGNHAMMLTIPFVLYGLFRYLYLVQVKNIGAAPEEVLLSDRPLQIDIVLWGLSIFLIFYVLPI